MKVMKNERQRRSPKLEFGGRFNYFIAACWLCVNMNDSFSAETCFVKPNTIIANEGTEWKHCFLFSNQDVGESAWAIDE